MLDPLSGEGFETRDWVLVRDKRIAIRPVYTSLLQPIQLRNASHFAASPYGGPIECSKTKKRTLDEWGESMGSIAAVAHALPNNSFSITFLSSAGKVYKRDVESNTITLTNQLEEPVPWSMRLREWPSAWLTLRPSGELTSVIVAQGTTFYRANQGEKFQSAETPWAMSEGSYTKMVANWSNQSVAIFHSSGLIQVVLSNLTEILACVQLATPTTSLKLLTFVSTSMLAVQERSSQTINFFSLSDSSAGYEYDSPDERCFGSEPDGLKIFGTNSLTFVNCVSDDELAVLGAASDEPGSFLYESEKRMGRDFNPYEYLSVIKDMRLAVQQCCRAAAAVGSPAEQRLLLRAARLGMVYSNVYDSESLVSLRHRLRVVNECKLPRVGIPITHAQLAELGTDHLLNRLVEVDYFGLTIRICEWVGEKEGIDRVLLSWLKRLITSSDKKDYVAVDARIAGQIADYPHVSFAEAAEKALEHGNQPLARLLVAREKNETKQVELLLRFGDVTEALGRAARSQQPALILLVIRHLIRTVPKHEYEMQIRKIPQAQIVYQEYVRQKSGPQMLALLEQSCDYERKILYHLDDCIAHASGPFQDEEWSQSLQKAAKAAKELRDPQLEELLHEAASHPGLNIRQTFMEAVADPEAVQRIRTQAKLSDKQFWHWNVEGLSAKHRWTHLNEFSKKKSPIGYLPFVRAAVKHGNKVEAEKYFAKVSAYHEKIEAFLEMGQPMQAAKLAVDRKDEEALIKIIRNKHVNPETQREINQLKDLM